MGAVTIVDERESGTLQYLLSNPVTKGEFYFGRSVGLLLATTSVIIIGFGAASAVVYTTGISNYFPIIMIMLFAALLNAVMLGIALIISEFSKRKATAMGIGIMVWFLLAVVSSLDQLVIAVSLKLGTTAAMFIVLLDPVETSRELTVFGAGLGSSQMTNAALLVQFVWQKQRLRVHAHYCADLDSGHLHLRVPSLQPPRRSLAGGRPLLTGNPQFSVLVEAGATLVSRGS